MFNNYNNHSRYTNNVSHHVNAISGTLIKTYAKSWFQRFHLKSTEAILTSNDEVDEINKI